MKQGIWVLDRFVQNKKIIAHFQYVVRSARRDIGTPRLPREKIIRYIPNTHHIPRKTTIIARRARAIKYEYEYRWADETVK